MSSHSSLILTTPAHRRSESFFSRSVKVAKAWEWVLIPVPRQAFVPVLGTMILPTIVAGVLTPSVFGVGLILWHGYPLLSSLLNTIFGLASWGRGSSDYPLTGNERLTLKIWPCTRSVGQISCQPWLAVFSILYGLTKINFNEYDVTWPE